MSETSEPKPAVPDLGRAVQQREAFGALPVPSPAGSRRTGSSVTSSGSHHILDLLAVVADDVLPAVRVGVDRPVGAVGEGACADQPSAHSCLSKLYQRCCLTIGPTHSVAPAMSRSRKAWLDCEGFRFEIVYWSPFEASLTEPPR